MATGTEVSTYTLSSCPKCGCAIGFSTVRSSETHRQQAGHRRTVSEWAVAGRNLRTTTSRDELNEHMRQSVQERIGVKR